MWIQLPCCCILFQRFFTNEIAAAVLIRRRYYSFTYCTVNVESVNSTRLLAAPFVPRFVDQRKKMVFFLLLFFVFLHCPICLICRGQLSNLEIWISGCFIPFVWFLCRCLGMSKPICLLPASVFRNKELLIASVFNELWCSCCADFWWFLLIVLKALSDGGYLGCLLWLGRGLRLFAAVFEDGALWGVSNTLCKAWQDCDCEFVLVVCACHRKQPKDSSGRR